MTRYFSFCILQITPRSNRTGTTKSAHFFSHLNRCFKTLPLSDNLSIDETMIKYYGRHGTKQFVRGKPIRFGYKLFSLASPSGYLYHAEPYCGRDTKLSETSLGLGGNVVLSLVNECHVSESYHLFFDNWFTSFEILDMLKEHKIGATGTIRADRCKNAPLPSKKDMEKSGRGTYSQVSDENHVLTKWYDNSVVSNSIFTDTTCSASRYSWTDRKIVQVPMPKVIQCYNQSMGGIDLFDEFVNKYRTKIRSKKWWWPFFHGASMHLLSMPGCCRRKSYKVRCHCWIFAGPSHSSC